MRHAPATDPLALWRGIDDAIWREAAREAVKRTGQPAADAPPHKPLKTPRVPVRALGKLLQSA